MRVGFLFVFLFVFASVFRKAGTKVSPFADTESGSVVACQATDTTYAEMLVAQSHSTCTTAKRLKRKTNVQQFPGRAKLTSPRPSQYHLPTTV